MRRQHFAWTYLVLASVLTIYGSYSLIYNAIKGKAIPTLGLVFLIIGSVMLLVFLVLFIISIIQKKKAKPSPVVEEVKEEPKIEEEPVKVEKKEEVKPAPKKKDYSDEVVYERRQSYSIYDNESTTVYVKKVGYGPVLRVCGSQIVDMRSNDYYTIDGRMVKLNGTGPIFEIYGDKIKNAFGGYLYELSGSSIYKVFGGYYASISGNYLQTHDLKEKYELSGSLNKKQILAVAALLFGNY